MWVIELYDIFQCTTLHKWVKEIKATCNSIGWWRMIFDKQIANLLTYFAYYSEAGNVLTLYLSTQSHHNMKW